MIKSVQTPHFLTLTLVFLLFAVNVFSTKLNADEQSDFIQGCLKSKGIQAVECECMYRETSGELPAEEAAFLIASVSGDMDAIQESAGKLSPDQITAVLSSTWLSIVDKCLVK